MSTLNVTNLKHGSSSTNAIVFASDGTCDVKASNIAGHKNLIINGAMNIAQRGTSSTSTGYQTVDRFFTYHGGTDEAPTYSQHALTSSDTGPWAKGFRYSFHIQNGNQTGGAGAADQLTVAYALEAQDLAYSGWDYTSSSSYITLSFWIKSSVAQDFKCFLKTEDGTEKSYPFATGSLSANTWTKVTKKIPGHSDLTFDNNAHKGLEITWSGFQGGDVTGSVTENAWMTWSGSTRTADQTSTWYTTNDATFEITGVQLEVGDTATRFEHRTYGDELARCQRYYIKDTDTVQGGSYIKATTDLDNVGGINVRFPVTMRADPALTLLGTTYRTGGHTDAQSSFKNGFIWGRKTYGNNSDTSCMAYATGGFTCDSEL